MACSLLTVSDLHEHLLDTFNQNGKASSGRQDRVLRRAAEEAIRILPTLHDWNYFRRTGGFNTNPPITYDSAAYTASDRKLTLSTGSWHVDAVMGAIDISAVRYTVLRRLSNTVLELESGPAENVTTSCIWNQFRYLLPADVDEITDLADTRYSWNVERVTVSELFWWQTVRTTSSYPVVWAIYPSRQLPGRKELWLSGSGVTAIPIQYMYRAGSSGYLFPEILSGTANGTVSISGRTATFSVGILKSLHAGSVLRVSESSERPTGNYGRLERSPTTGDYTEKLNPAEQEFVIDSITSGTVALLASSGTTVSARGFSISPLINVAQGGLWELLLRMSEEQYDIITRAEASIRRTSKAERMQAMIIAMSSDANDTSTRSFYRGPGIVVEDS